MAFFLNIYDRQFLDAEGEPYSRMIRAKPEFFERITAILPMHITHFSREQLLNTMEILTKRGLGSDRLFNNYIYMQLERHILKFNGK